MEATVGLFKVPSDDRCDEEQWTCAFIDGESDQLRCTTMLTDSHGEQHALYVERYDVERDDDPLKRTR